MGGYPAVPTITPVFGIMPEIGWGSGRAAAVAAVPCDVAWGFVGSFGFGSLISCAPIGLCWLAGISAIAYQQM
jgi:hypothetical protein